jgi:AcrR family transcriptional regulator
MPAKSFSRAAERRTERRQQILDTASQLFSEHGYESVTLRAIAEKLGYSHAALYRYFPDKASLLAEICRDTFGHLTVELDAQQSQAQGPEAQLLAVSLGFVRFGLAHPHHFQVVFSGVGNGDSSAANKHMDAIGRSLYERLIQTFVACSEAIGLSTETRMLDANTWWISLFGTTHVLTSSCAVITPSSVDDVVLRHIHAMWQGFRVLSAPAKAEAARKKLARSPRTTPKTKSKRADRRNWQPAAGR